MKPGEPFDLPGGGSCRIRRIYTTYTPKGRFFGHISINPMDPAECDNETARLLADLLERIDLLTDEAEK